MAKAPTADDLKIAAARAALAYVEDGMKLGLGTGSTAAKFVDLLGEKVKAGLNVVCVPTSDATFRQAQALGIPLTTLDATPHLDLTIDGADEIDGEINLMKGGGGALLREKIVATASDRMIVIADDTKMVRALGRFPLPVEVIPFGLGATQAMLTEFAGDAGCEGKIVLRTAKDGKPFVTDNANYILDCHFGEIPDPEALDMLVKLIPGVVENGLFLGLAERAIVAGPSGVRDIEAPEQDDFE